MVSYKDLFKLLSGWRLIKPLSPGTIWAQFKPNLPYQMPFQPYSSLLCKPRDPDSDRWFGQTIRRSLDCLGSQKHSTVLYLPKEMISKGKTNLLELQIFFYVHKGAI